jgi:hypothetical protein
MSESPDHFQLSIHDVRSWVSARARLLTEVAEIERRLAAAVALFPALQAEIGAIDLDREPRKYTSRHDSLTAFILRALNDAPEGMKLAELRQAVAADPTQAERFRRTPNAVYGSLNFLASRGDVRKRGHLVFATAVLDRILSERGNNWQPPEPDDGLTGVIIKYLEGRPAGAAAGEIKQHLIADPVFGERVGTSKNFVYNRLARLFVSGKLVKDREQYKLPAAGGVATKTAERPSEDGEFGL